jgi:hypothetical protein
MVISFHPESKTLPRVDLKELLITKLLMYATSRAGKSRLLRQLLEQTNGYVQQLIFDLEGEFSSLREVFDNYIILGKDETDCDIVITAQNAATTALTLYQAGCNIIIDLYGHKDFDTIAGNILDALMALPKRQTRMVLTVFDEAQRYAPEEGSTACSLPLRTFANQGGKRGFGLVLVTTRIAMLDKNVMHTCNNFIIGLITEQNDLSRAAKNLGIKPSEATYLTELRRGTFYAKGPAIAQKAVKVTGGAIRSPHYDLGDIIPPTPPAAKHLASIIAELKRLPEPVNTAKSGDPKREAELRKQIVLLENDNTKLKGHISAINERYATVRGLFKQMLSELPETLEPEPSERAEQPRPSVSAPTRPSNVPPNKPSNASPQHPRKNTAPLETVKRSVGDPQRLLNTLRNMESLGFGSLPRNNLAVLAGTSPTSSTFHDNVASLSKQGDITYPEKGEVALTEQGRAKTEPPSEKPSLSDLHESWLRYLEPYERDLLKVVIGTYPQVMSRDALALAAGKSPKSSVFHDAVARFKNLNLVVYPMSGHVVADNLLFPKILW